MKTAAITTPQTDMQLAVQQTNTRAKAQPGGPDFKDMLSGAIGGLKNAAEKPENAARKTEKADAKSPAEHPRDKTANVKTAQPERKDEEPDETTVANAAAMQLQAQPTAETQTDTVDVEVEIPVQAVQVVQTVQTLQAQALAAQVQPEVEPLTQEVQTIEQAETTDSTEQTQVHTQTVDRQTQTSGEEQAAQTVQAARGQATGAERTAVQDRTQAHPRRTVHQDEAQRQTLPDEAEDGIVSAEVVRQPNREVNVRTAQQAETDPAQARFDDMLARARQKLDRTGNVPVQEKQVDAEQQTQAADVPEMPEPQVTKSEPKPAISQEEAAVRQPDGKENKTEPAKTETGVDRAERTEKPERAERKPAKAVQKAEEPDTTAVEPKTQRMQSHEVVRTERQAPAQAARTPDQFEQIRAQVIRNLEDQKMEFNMQLQPKELGTVNVKMILEGGKLAVEIVAANAKSAELLSKQTEALISSLKLGNMELTSVNVVTASQNASGSMDGEYNLGNFQNQAGQQEAQGSHAGADKRGSQTETAGQPEDEAVERQPKGILNYSI